MTSIASQKRRFYESLSLRYNMFSHSLFQEEDTFQTKRALTTLWRAILSYEEETFSIFAFICVQLYHYRLTLYNYASGTLLWRSNRTRKARSLLHPRIIG